MNEHERVQQTLATYRDATGAERAAADAHRAKCRACADAFAGYGDVDARVAAATDRALPPRLSGSFASILAQQAAPQPLASAHHALSGRLVPAAIILLILVAASVLLLSTNNAVAPATSTPTLTTTLTPTMVTARETQPAALAFAAQPRPLVAPVFAPTPAPAPGPRDKSATLFAGPPAHATITH
jgi:hypothetical protein